MKPSLCRGSPTVLVLCCAVMALERVPADIRKEGGVARMSDPQMIKEIKQAVTIPVMAKVSSSPVALPSERKRVNPGQAANTPAQAAKAGRSPALEQERG